jgi:hypothetical protein
MLKRPPQVCSIADMSITKPAAAAPSRLLFSTVSVLLGMLVITPSLFAGPPFRTDDPETVEYKHWEFYLANTYSNDKGNFSGTAPHLEANYGVIPNLQLHILAPMAFDKSQGEATVYGFGDLELGVKYRFIQETDSRPMVGTFPILHLPTGNQRRGLGNGEAQFFLPLWLQKAWGPWQSYGGGGYWINPGSGNKDYWFLGWQGQREITKWFTIGAEIFYNTPPTTEGDYQVGYNIGGLVNFTENDHLIFSAGGDIHGQNRFSYYIAYLWTWGPPENKANTKKEKGRKVKIFRYGARAY